MCIHIANYGDTKQLYVASYNIIIIGFIAHTKLQMERTRVANEVNSVAKGL